MTSLSQAIAELIGIMGREKNETNADTVTRVSRYLCMLPFAPAIHTVVIAQNPYPNSSVIPAIGCPFSYTCTWPTPSVKVLCNTVAVSIDGHCGPDISSQYYEYFKQAHLMLASGTVFFDARVTAARHTVASEAEAKSTAKILLHLLRRTVQTDLSCVNILCLGIESLSIYRLLSSSWDPDYYIGLLPTLRMETTWHPAYVARTWGDSRALQDSDATKMLVQVVKRHQSATDSDVGLLQGKMNDHPERGAAQIIAKELSHFMKNLSAAGSKCAAELKKHPDACTSQAAKNLANSLKVFSRSLMNASGNMVGIVSSFSVAADEPDTSKEPEPSRYAKPAQPAQRVATQTSLVTSRRIKSSIVTPPSRPSSIGSRRTASEVKDTDTKGTVTVSKAPSQAVVTSFEALSRSLRTASDGIVGVLSSFSLAANTPLTVSKDPKPSRYARPAQIAQRVAAQSIRETDSITVRRIKSSIANPPKSTSSIDSRQTASEVKATDAVEGAVGTSKGVMESPATQDSSPAIVSKVPPGQASVPRRIAAPDSG